MGSSSFRLHPTRTDFRHGASVIHSFVLARHGLSFYSREDFASSSVQLERWGGDGSVDCKVLGCSTTSTTLPSKLPSLPARALARKRPLVIDVTDSLPKRPSVTDVQDSSSEDEGTAQSWAADSAPISDRWRAADVLPMPALDTSADTVPARSVKHRFRLTNNVEVPSFLEAASCLQRL